VAAEDKARKAGRWSVRRRRRPTGQDAIQNVERELNIAEVSYDGLTWVNVVNPSLAEMGHLKERFGFHPLALEDCLSRVQLPKVDEYDVPPHLFLVLHFPLFDREMRITVPSQVSIFVGANYVVTTHRGDLRPLVKLFQDCQESDMVRQGLMAQSVGYLLYRILDGLVDYCFPILNKVIEAVDDLEMRILNVRARGLVRELSMMERDVISYRRIVRPQIDVLELLERKEYPFLKVDPDVYFGDLADHMRRISAELEDLKAVLDTFYETHSTLVTHHTNEVIRVLTIVGTVILPAVVISGLYGMNVPLPMDDSPWALGMLVGISAAISVGMLAFFRLRRWI
jgi:magnesium transporter